MMNINTVIMTVETIYECSFYKLPLFNLSEMWAYDFLDYLQWYRPEIYSRLSKNDREYIADDPSIERVYECINQALQALGCDIVQEDQEDLDLFLDFMAKNADIEEDLLMFAENELSEDSKYSKYIYA